MDTCYISVQNEDNKVWQAGPYEISNGILPLAQLRPCEKQRTQHLYNTAAKTANASVLIRRLFFNAIQGKKWHYIRRIRLMQLGESFLDGIRVAHKRLQEHSPPPFCRYLISEKNAVLTHFSGRFLFSFSKLTKCCKLQHFCVLTSFAGTVQKRRKMLWILIFFRLTQKML